MENANDVLAEAQRLGFPTVMLAGGSDHLAGEAKWRARFDSLRPGEIQQVRQQLAAHAAATALHDVGRAVVAEIDAQNAPLSEDELAEERQGLADARAEVQRYAAERPERVEGLLREILQALRK